MSLGYIIWVGRLNELTSYKSRGLNTASNCPKIVLKNTRYDTLTAPDLKGPDARLTFEGFENCFSLRGADQLHSNRVLRIIDTDPKHRNAQSPPSHHK